MTAVCLLFLYSLFIPHGHYSKYQINIRLHELIQCAIYLYNDKAVSTNGLGYNGSYTYIRVFITFQ